MNYTCSVCKQIQSGESVRILYRDNEGWTDDDDNVCPTCWLKAHEALWPGKEGK